MAENSRIRKKFLRVYLSDDEVEILNMKSFEMDMSKSDYIRDLILFGNRDDGDKLSKTNFKLFLYEINRIGNNLNQIEYNSYMKASSGKNDMVAFLFEFMQLLSSFQVFCFDGTEQNLSVLDVDTNNVFHLKLLDEEFEILKMKSFELSVSKTRYVREMIVFGNSNVENKLSEHEVRLLLDTIHNTGEIINQIAFDTNSKRSTNRNDIILLQREYEKLLALYQMLCFGE